MSHEIPDGMPALGPEELPPSELTKKAFVALIEQALLGVQAESDYDGPLRTISYEGKRYTFGIPEAKSSDTVCDLDITEAVNGNEDVERITAYELFRDGTMEKDMRVMRWGNPADLSVLASMEAVLAEKRIEKEGVDPQSLRRVTEKELADLNEMLRQVIEKGDQS